MTKTDKKVEECTFYKNSQQKPYNVSEFTILSYVSSFKYKQG